MRPQAISVGDANAVHFLLALTSGGSQQLAASEQESGDRVRVEGSYRRRHSKGWRTEEPGDVLILSAPCIVKPPPSPGAKFSQGRSGSPAIGTPSICSSSTAQPLTSTSARIDLLTVDGSAARVYLGPALFESSSNPHRHGAVQEHARRSRSRAGNEDRWPVAGSEIHAACRGPAAQPATTALPRSHRGTARWGWRCTSEPGRRTNVDVEARCDEAGTARPSWRRGRRRHHEDTTGGSDVKPMPPP